MGRFGRPKPFRGRVRTRSARFLDPQINLTSQGRSGDAPGEPRAARRRPKASPGRPRDAPRASGTTPKTLLSAARVVRRSQISAYGPIFECFRSTRESSEVRFVSLLPVFYRCRTFCASNARGMEKPRKNGRFGVENRGPGRPGDTRRSKVERKNGHVARKCTLEVPSGPPKIC